MKLYIAEKPSLGKAIANALPKPHKNHQGYIELANGDVVTWCIGHVLEQADPEVYNKDFKKWQLAHLPIIPQQWLLTPKTNTRSQLSVLRKLIKQADSLVHAGDPDREGQLLVDEVLNYCKVTKSKKHLTQRLLINDLNLPAVKRALANMKANSDFMPLSISALARSRADWLYGINLTRVYTLQGQKSGFNSVLSVGRVQTPLLGLVVQRDNDIESFISKPFYEVNAHIQCDLPNIEQNNNHANDDKPVQFTAKWQPSVACQPYIDEEKRIIVKTLAENVVNRIKNQPALVTSVKNQQKKQAAPLPYNLSSLQIDAAKRFSMNAKLVLDICQNLYEKHKLITYPRSDSRYLPTEQHSQASKIINLLATSKQSYAQFAQNAVAKLKSKAWNNSKVSAHHAIIPTEKSLNNILLNSFEKNIYQLIVCQYLAQFYPDYIYDETQVLLTIAGGLFKATAKTERQLGWRVLYQSSKKQQNTAQTAATEQKLPPLQQGETLYCRHGELLAKNTQAPKAFTDATLLAAMTNIARYVDDKSIKKILKNTDGLGTEATRAGIIELLFKRQYIYRSGKNIQASDIGKALINALPDNATKANMTAQWEAELNDIAEKQSNYQHFMTPLENTINAMITQAAAQPLVGLPTVAFKAKRKTRKFTGKANSTLNNKTTSNACAKNKTKISKKTKAA
jgi:DNA topoisomerase III